jgi:putative sigma-54 modulation protein
MKTNVTFRHLKSHPDLENAALAAADGFAKFLDNIISTDVVFKNEIDKTVEFTVRVQGNTLVAKDSSDDFYKSLNDASDKIIRQIHKFKTKRFGL